MSNQILSLLRQWYPQRDSSRWVLGVLYNTVGSSYRKAGALMLFGDAGQQLGMLSGGCLESDLHSKARRVLENRRSSLVTYDGTDEDDMSFQMGIGCGGRVDIMLQVLDAENHYLGLPQLLSALERRQVACYRIQIGTDVASQSQLYSVSTEELIEQPFSFDGATLSLRASPPPHLFVAGGGIDARPVVAIAKQLGWQISLWDPRPAHGRAEHFAQADQLLRGEASAQQSYLRANPCDVAIVMTHSVSLDAGILAVLHDNPPCYVALLGPEHRLQEVVACAGITRPSYLAGPAGLRIGAQLPETIALSILAECQAALTGSLGGSISGVLTK